MQRKTLTSLWYNLSQGKLHSLVTRLQQLWSSDTGSTFSTFLETEDSFARGLPRFFPVFPIPSFSATVVCVLIYLAARWRQLRSFMLAANSSAAQRHQESRLTAPATEGVINQSKAAVSHGSWARMGKWLRAAGFVKSNLLLSLGERVTCALWLTTLQVEAICCLIWNALAPRAAVINAKYLSESSKQTWQEGVAMWLPSTDGSKKHSRAYGWYKVRPCQLVFC